MFYQEKVIEDRLYCRTSPTGTWRFKQLLKDEAKLESPCWAGIEYRAMELYAGFIGCSMTAAEDFMWEQCSIVYREAWRVIASEELNIVSLFE